MALDVTALCKESHTDKNLGEFPHSDMYEALFSRFRDKPICLLEIGVNRGGSIPVWEQYFPKAKLLAVDINPKSLLYTTNLTTVDLVDQYDAEALIRYAEVEGPFDIVIDDGSHISSHQILTFKTLWPYLRPGGIFVIEDTETSYMDLYTEDDGFTCIEYFKFCIDDINKRIADRSELHRDINTIVFKQDMIAITKRGTSDFIAKSIMKPQPKQMKKDTAYREELSLKGRDKTWRLQWVKKEIGHE